MTQGPTANLFPSFVWVGVWSTTLEYFVLGDKCFVVYLMNIICVPLSFQEAGLFLLVQFCLLQSGLEVQHHWKNKPASCKVSGAKIRSQVLTIFVRYRRKTTKALLAHPVGMAVDKTLSLPIHNKKKEEKRLATYRMISSKLNHLLRKGYKGQGHTPSLPGSTGSAWWCRNPGTDSRETC